MNDAERSRGAPEPGKQHRLCSEAAQAIEVRTIEFLKKHGLPIRWSGIGAPPSLASDLAALLTDFRDQTLEEAARFAEWVEKDPGGVPVDGDAIRELKTPRLR